MKSILLIAALLPSVLRAAPVAPKTACATQQQAHAAAMVYALTHGGTLVLTSGTPSMEPLIHGKTYVVVEKEAYAAITTKDILLYRGRPNASKPDTLTMLHRAVGHDRYGWMMRGDNNRWTESWDRVTPQTYLGTVVAIFSFPQA